CEQYNSLPVTF
nr:immunoglobulin light chain junction region [Macaca mulatta]